MKVSFFAVDGDDGAHRFLKSPETQVCFFSVADEGWEVLQEIRGGFLIVWIRPYFYPQFVNEMLDLVVSSLN